MDEHNDQDRLLTDEQLTALLMKQYQDSGASGADARKNLVWQRVLTAISKKKVARISFARKNIFAVALAVAASLLFGFYFIAGRQTDDELMQVKGGLKDIKLEVSFYILEDGRYAATDPKQAGIGTRFFVRAVPPTNVYVNVYAKDAASNAYHQLIKAQLMRQEQDAFIPYQEGYLSFIKEAGEAFCLLAYSDQISAEKDNQERSRQELDQEGQCFDF